MMEEGWIGKTIFYENWADAAEAPGISPVLGLPGDLVLNDIPEYSWLDDLTGKVLDTTLVIKAKLEEFTEMYRRRVWLEKQVAARLKKTGKPPTPVRWGVTNRWG